MQSYLAPAWVVTGWADEKRRSHLRTPTIEHDGWALVSAEERHEQNPESFWIPPRSTRESLSPGDAAQLLFDIETRHAGAVVDRGVDRMWVIIKHRVGTSYVGVLDSDPGRAGGLRLHRGDTVSFLPEHVIAIETPPRDYVLETYGANFFDR